MAQSFTVDLDGGPGFRALQTAESDLVPAGNSVELGWFDAGFDVAANASDLLVLRSAWNPFLSTSVRDIFGEPGRFAASESSADDTFTGQKIYLWAFKTTGNSLPDGNLANVEQHGLFSSTAAAWVFPSRFALPPANSAFLTSGDVDQMFVGTATSDHLVLAVVPEPAETAAVTGTLLFLAASSYRRLRS
jgi:hypothetical protein